MATGTHSQTGNERGLADIALTVIIALVTTIMQIVAGPVVKDVWDYMKPDFMQDEKAEPQPVQEDSPKS